jgi:hypothetical protein
MKVDIEDGLATLRIAGLHKLRESAQLSHSPGAATSLS